MFWFHRHEFDPEKWELIQRITLTNEWATGDDRAVGHLTIYSNTCKTCGKLVFEKLKS